jgi:hypothetical protein
MDPDLKSTIADLFRKLPSPFNRIPAEQKRSRILRRIQKQNAGNPSAKVFGIGLSKTGTTSLARALDILGYEAVSWTRGGRVLGWPEFYLADAATDTPCCAHFESLYYTFERSKFIYTVRDLDEWVQSAKNYFGLETPHEFRQHWNDEEHWNGDTWHSDWQQENAFRALRIHECLYARHDTWEEAYHSYEQRVRHFFADKPADRITSMNIPDGDGWNQLCTFLKRDVPSRPFPHANQSR